VLHDVESPPLRMFLPVISHLKLRARMNIAERRLPQDGRIKFKEYTRTGIDIDLRVATGPMVFGEKVVMRLLDKASTSVSLEMMGYSEYNLKIYEKLIKSPYGMILHVGPTGSGKTTTLYAALNKINDPGINIQTAEDPVEYQLFGINQMQMRREIGLTFSTALRLMEIDPKFIFSVSQPQQYQFTKEYYPDLYCRIKERVAEGRWEPVGGMWVEPDCNLISGESFVRQILYGKKFFREEFGKDTRTAWLPDVFGFAGSMPQILKEAGVEYFYTNKLYWESVNRFPHSLFW